MKPLIVFTTAPSRLLVSVLLACFTLAQVARAKPPNSEDRGNGNSAAENVEALNINTTGSNNTAHGWFSLFSNTSGSSNTAGGFQALYTNGTGHDNTASGDYALFNNTSGNYNTADGNAALFANLTGSENTAIGRNALSDNTVGDENIALGVFAGVNITGSNNIDIGNVGEPGEAGTIRIGSSGTHMKAFIAGIRGVATGHLDPIPVLIDSAGQLGTVVSSRRFKKEIKPMDKASEAILALKPVTFHYNSDSAGTPQFGLIAEEVAEINPDLVVRDDKGEIYTVRYDAVNAMLLNEFLKEHRKVEGQDRRIQEQEATITQLKKEMRTVVAQLKEQTTQIQKMSAQVEMTKPTPQMVLRNP